MLEININYEKIECYNSKTTLNKLSSKIKLRAKGLIEKEIDILSNFKYKPSLFYELPTIHKHPIINKDSKESSILYLNNPLSLQTHHCGSCLWNSLVELVYWRLNQSFPKIRKRFCQGWLWQDPLVIANLVMGFLELKSY